MIPFSEIQITHGMQFDGLSECGLCAYYTCPANVPHEQIFKILLRDQACLASIGIHIIAARIKMMRFEGDVDIVAALNNGDASKIRLGSATVVSYEAVEWDGEPVDGLWWRRSVAAKKNTVKQIWEQKKLEDVNFEYPFAPETMKAIIGSKICYGENATFQDMRWKGEKENNLKSERPNLVPSHDDWFNTQLRSAIEELKIDPATGEVRQILGVTDGMWFLTFWGTTSHLHSETGHLGSVHFLYKGSASKFWLLMDALELIKLNKYLPKDRCPNYVLHKQNFVTPEFLDKVGIKYGVIEHRANDLFVTFPRGSHMVVNSGLGLGIAKNWLGYQSIPEIRTIPRCPCGLADGYQWLFDRLYGSEAAMKIIKVIGRKRAKKGNSQVAYKKACLEMEQRREETTTMATEGIREKFPLEEEEESVAVAEWNMEGDFEFPEGSEPESKPEDEDDAAVIVQEEEERSSETEESEEEVTKTKEDEQEQESEKSESEEEETPNVEEDKQQQDIEKSEENASEAEDDEQKEESEKSESEEDEENGSPKTNQDNPVKGDDQFSEVEEETPKPRRSAKRHSGVQQRRSNQKKTSLPTAKAPKRSRGSTSQNSGKNKKSLSMEAEEEGPALAEPQALSRDQLQKTKRPSTYEDPLEDLFPPDDATQRDVTKSENLRKIQKDETK